MNEDEVLEKDYSLEILIEPNDAIDEFAEFLPPNNKSKADILRIEEPVYHSWSGVSGCDHPSRKDAELKAAYEGWVKKKLFEYRHLNYITYGHLGGTMRTGNSRAPWPDNNRSCWGNLSITCFIEFYKR